MEMRKKNGSKKRYSSAFIDVSLTALVIWEPQRGNQRQ